MIVKAYKELVGYDVKLYLEGDTLDGITWLDDRPQPDRATVEAKIAELQADYDAKQYQRDRKYPNLGEQFDLLFKDINEGTLDKTGGFYTAIKAVKDAHPKPRE